MPDFVTTSRFRDAIRLGRYTAALMRVANARRARWHEDAWTVRDLLGREDRPWGRTYIGFAFGHPLVRWRGCGPDIDQHEDIEGDVRRACR